MGRVSDFFREQNIALAQQQRAKMVAMDRQVEELESKVQILETENLRLKAEVNPLKKTIQRLEQQLEQKGPNTVVHNLEPKEIEMMKAIGNAKTLTADDIGKGLALHSVPVEHYLGRLLKSKYIVQNHVPMVGAMYSLSDLGNAYLVDNNLVPLSNFDPTVKHVSNPRGHCCDHCGSLQLRRTGARPDRVFGDVGVKEDVYSCLSCGKESAYTQEV